VAGVMPDKNSDELFHFQENQIQPLTPEELFSQITAEIDFYQQQITILQQQLAVLTGGSTNG
jgi:prefoldin subunit 5